MQTGQVLLFGLLLCFYSGRTARCVPMLHAVCKLLIRFFSGRIACCVLADGAVGKPPGTPGASSSSPCTACGDVCSRVRE
jgi:hypothetical protein